MRNFSVLIFVVFLLPLSPYFALGQNGNILQELDSYWAVVSRDIEAGDYESSLLAYHPDAVWEDGGTGVLRTMLESDAIVETKEFSDRVKSGDLKVGIEFRFASRINNHNTAHEICFVYMWVQEGDTPPKQND
jgi:hypothetical protein